jgi:hypothetical protein
MLTIFTSPKPFRDHIALIQKNALRSWVALGDGAEVLLIGDEEGIAEAASEFGARHFPDVARNELGTPLVSSIFAIARENARHPHLCYVNADVMLLGDLLTAARRAAERFSRFLLVGRRWDLDIREALRLSPDWEASVRERIRAEGHLHPPTGSDFFVFPRAMFVDMPSFALGRAGWDNWMIYAGRRAHVPVIDGTGAVTAVHQLHDYAHLPGGQPHFRLPESRGNVLMGGGRVAVFTIRDTTWRYGPQGLVRRGLRERGIARAIESALYAAVGAGPVARRMRMLLHPVDTIRYYSRAARRRILRLFEGRSVREGGR